MITFIVRRLLFLSLTMVGVSLFVFQILQSLMPEERVAAITGDIHIPPNLV